MNLEQPLATFIAEGRELLAEVEGHLLGVEPSAPDAETINAIFRAAHTIKGSAGLFGLDHIVGFAHALESVLDRVREGDVTLDGPLVQLLLSCCDHLSLLIDGVANGQTTADAATTASGAPLLEQLLRHHSPAEQPSAAAREPGAAIERSAGRGAANDHWHLSLRFGKDVLRNGMDPLSFINYLGRLGTIAGIVTLFDDIPSVEEMDPEACYLGFEIALRSDADKATIENVFEFVRDDCELRILAPNSRIADYIRLIEQLPEDGARLGEMLVRCGALTARELEAGLSAQRSAPESLRPIGSLLIQRGSVHPLVVEAALEKQLQAREVKLQEPRSIRIDADKLDHLINLVGELIIAAAGTQLLARSARNPELQQATHTLSDLVEEVRDGALQLRMVKIGATFKRFLRVVHDVSRELGKEIALTLSGEDTELDKTVVEKLGDPLLHLVRNAIDHGIEAPELRVAQGKPARGTVRLNAYHDSGSIVIEVSDDGGGLKRERILAKAVERGLIEPGRSLSDSEVYGLIFEPGFSTAEQVTNLSGRGVGMDVVKRNITALRGSIAIASEEGTGTTVSVRLPLTLAMIDGFLVALGDAMFVVPLEMVEECLELTDGADRGYTNLRGHVLPFIRLRELFAVGKAPGARQNVVVVRHGGQRAGLVVDSLLGEFQTVIKPLGKWFSHVKCVSGSSILGSGEVALILDVPTLVQQATQAKFQN